MLPKDPFILLSFVNTKLRDRDASLQIFCEEENADEAALCEKLQAIGYAYVPARNQFL